MACRQGCNEDQSVILHVVKRPETKRGLVLALRYWVIERSFAWMTRLQRLATDLEQLPPQNPRGVDIPVFARTILARYSAARA